MKTIGIVAEHLGDGGLHCASLVLTQTDFEAIERNQRGAVGPGWRDRPQAHR